MTKVSARSLLVAGLYQTGCPQSAIAAHVGLSRQRINQILDRAGIKRDPFLRVGTRRLLRQARAKEAA